MADLPTEADALLSVAPADFVAERARLARELRDAGRKDEAAAVAAMWKPAPVLLAANHAARRRQAVAKEAARAATRVRKKLGHDAAAQKALDDSLRTLEQVAVAFLGDPGEATRRRLHDLFQNVVADEEAMTALTRGALTEEPEPAGFAAYAGATLTQRKTSPARGSRAREAAEKKRRERERALAADVAAAELRLEEAAGAERQAAVERAAAERELERLRKKLERLASE